MLALRMPGYLEEECFRQRKLLGERSGAGVCEYVRERSECMEQTERESGKMWDLWGNGTPNEGHWLFLFSESESYGGFGAETNILWFKF